MDDETAAARLCDGDGNVLATLRGIEGTTSLLGSVAAWPPELQAAAHICLLRHGQASEVWIGIEARGAALVLRVRDNGVGIAPGRLRPAGALGLQGMRERAELVDGKLRIRRLAPQGTLVLARVPLPRRGGQA